MNQKKIIFRDQEIIEFCQATQDNNEIHNPEFMRNVGKRVIVPGMYALSHTINLDAGHLKTKVNYIKVLFNSLLSSGDFATLCTIPNLQDPFEVRLSAINHKDTLTSANEYTRMSFREHGFEEKYQGLLCRLPIEPGQVETFARLVGTADPDVGNFLFAVAYASQALHYRIDNPEMEIEFEIDRVINGNSKISPFYKSLEIEIPSPFPTFIPSASIDYFIHFEREKERKLYTAHLRCECNGLIIFHSRYKLVGISDMIILRMAKDNRFRGAS
jgi:hypothetical protein